MPYTETFADKIVQVCVAKYNTLKKTGKPKTLGEWTLLSCFVQEKHGCEPKVVALGTGSKCLGAQQLTEGGCTLHDSHAEVVARRAFMLYLLQQIKNATVGDVSIFETNNGIFSLKPNIFFHFYSSHTPCGDASIFPKQQCPESAGNILKIDNAFSMATTSEHLHSLGEVAEAKDVPSTITAEESCLNDVCEEDFMNSDADVPMKKRKFQHLQESNNIQDGFNNVENTVKSEKKLMKHDIRLPGNAIKSEDKELKDNVGNDENKEIEGVNVKGPCDTFRTGAKCVAGETQDPRLPGMDYHVTGVLRTKPGRGDPTLSMSCSDKIFKWTVLGVQGALLMILLDKPVYVTTVVIGQCPYSQEAMQRAIFARFEGKLEALQLPEGYSVHTPTLLPSQVEFPHSRSYVMSHVPDGCKVMPTPTSIIWSDTHKHRESQEVATNGWRLGCTKQNIARPKSWLSICRRPMSNLVLDLVRDRVKGDLKDVSYSDLKGYSEVYLKAWEKLKVACLLNWTEKPKHLKDFKVMYNQPSF